MDGALMTLITRDLCKRERHLHLVASSPAPEFPSVPRHLQLVEAPKEAA
jgi:hypothetical protein